MMQITHCKRIEVQTRERADSTNPAKIIAAAAWIRYFLCAIFLLSLSPLLSPSISTSVTHARHQHSGTSSNSGMSVKDSLMTSRVWTSRQKHAMRERVREMFHHGYDSYMRYAFPHDELKPLSKSWTDSLGELGNARRHYPDYHGVALTLIDSLSTLAVLRNATEFARAVDWVSANINFDQDVRVNIFEANIRLLGGLLSAHLLALDPSLGLHPNYDGGLLPLAKDLGDRFMPAFKHMRIGEEHENETESNHTCRSGHRCHRRSIQLPYAWINLRHGVEAGETAEQCSAGVGTLLLEFGLLSHLTNDTKYYDVAEHALFALWSTRDPRTNLFGNSMSCLTGAFTNSNAGIGAGIDSAYEYLLKSYIMFDNVKFLHMWDLAYSGVNEYLKYDGDWYVESDMHSGRHTHVQFNSLTAFWPGLQTLIGDLTPASATHARHFSLWRRFDGVPERFLLQQNQLHSTERHYILRPELAESNYHLYRATRHPRYLDMAAEIFHSLERVARVPTGGYASIRDLESKDLEDRMHSFFLSEMVKYLYLTFDESNMVHAQERVSGRDARWIFTTEGHLFPILPDIQQKFGDARSYDGQFVPDNGGRTLASSFSASKYSLFSLPLSNMNRDTRNYYQHWKEQAGVDFKHLAQHARCPIIDAHLLPDPASERHRGEFYRLADVYERRRRIAYRCFSSSTSGYTSSSSLPDYSATDFDVHSGGGSFRIVHIPTGELLDIKNLGTPAIEIDNMLRLVTDEDDEDEDQEDGEMEQTQRNNRQQRITSKLLLRPIALDNEGHSYAHKLVARVNRPTHEVDDMTAAVWTRVEDRCSLELDGIGPSFGPPPTPIQIGDSTSTITPRISAYHTSHYRTADVVDASSVSSWDGCSSPADPTSFHGRFVVMHRGSCTFIDKIVMAQQHGAVGVIVINNPMEHEEVPTSRMAAIRHHPLNTIMMGDDGSGREIHIPSIMLPHAYGEELLSCMHAVVGEAARAMLSVELVRFQPYDMDIMRRESSSASFISTSSTAIAPPLPHLCPSVQGSPNSFTVTTMGGWSVEVVEHKERKTFMLKLY